MAGYKLKGRIPLRWLLFSLMVVWGTIWALQLLDIWRPQTRQIQSPRQKQLAMQMLQGMKLLSTELERSGVVISPYSDPNHTGFIGDELTPLTTTLGSIVSKRTSTHPGFAPLIFDMVREAGVKKGDVVAISASGSFPALIFATILAVEAIGAEPYLISSVGSSTWGANRPGWAWPDMESLFYRQGLIQSRSRYISPGGPDDKGPNLFESGMDLVKQIATRNGIELLESSSLTEAIERRLQLYLVENPSLYINIGGSHPAMGGCSHGHQFPPGLINQSITCQHQDRGLIIRFLEADIQVINLLDIPAIAIKNGLSIDPVPLPEFVDVISRTP